MGKTGDGHPSLHRPVWFHKTHLVKPDSANRGDGEHNEDAAGRDGFLQDRKRESYDSTRDPVGAHRHTHSSTSVPQRENLSQRCSRIISGES